MKDNVTPNPETFKKFWSNMWEKWIQLEKTTTDKITLMTLKEITREEVRQVLTEQHNWKAAEPDKIKTTCTNRSYRPLIK